MLFLFLQFSPGNNLREGKAMWVILSPLIGKQSHGRDAVHDAAL